jgi:hypothetical protein
MMQPGFEPIWDRITKLEPWEIKINLPEDFHLEGVIPYDIIIQDDKATIKIVAASREEAIHKVIGWVESCRR